MKNFFNSARNLPTFAFTFSKFLLTLKLDFLWLSIPYLVSASLAESFGPANNSSV